MEECGKVCLLQVLWYKINNAFDGLISHLLSSIYICKPLLYTFTFFSILMFFVTEFLS